jgi:hypothetical protein
VHVEVIRARVAAAGRRLRDHGCTGTKASSRPPIGWRFLTRRWS